LAPLDGVANAVVEAALEDERVAVPGAVTIVAEAGVFDPAGTIVEATVHTHGGVIAIRA
jgi:hypothetical protein